MSGDGPPAEKRRRTVGTLLRFTVSDGCGEVRTFDVSQEACQKMPFLERKITTTVGLGADDDGDDGDRHRVALPDGCTVEAFAALLYRVDPPNGLVSSRLQASDVDESITLLRTADFLLLEGNEELVPEVLALCRRHVHVLTDEDAARICAIPISGAGELSKDFTGGRLVARMDVDAATELAAAFCSSISITICDAQARALHDWLRVRGRTEQDIEKVLDNLNTYSRSCWFRGLRNRTLKNGASPWVQAFAVLAAERPVVFFRIFRDFTHPLTNCCCNADDECLEQFVSDLLLPFKGRDTTWNEISELLLALWDRTFYQSKKIIEPLLEILYGRIYTSDELRELLPKLITAEGTWVANVVTRIVMNTSAKDHMFGVNQLMTCKHWINNVTVPFLVMLESEAQLALIQKMMPRLGSASPSVQMYIGDALASGKL